MRPFTPKTPWLNFTSSDHWSDQELLNGDLQWFIRLNRINKLWRRWMQKLGGLASERGRGWSIGHHLEVIDWISQVASLVAGHRASDNGPRYPTCTAESLLWWDKDVWHILHNGTNEFSFPLRMKLFTVYGLWACAWKWDARSRCNNSYMILYSEGTIEYNKSSIAPSITYKMILTYLVK